MAIKTHEFLKRDSAKDTAATLIGNGSGRRRGRDWPQVKTLAVIEQANAMLESVTSSSLPWSGCALNCLCGG
ncbi:hypothetical protein QA640_24330 [Bradyrhizobium sp. CB82]|uniref:hypothetical protein n=1 Tax=Bradyrhizobium sp. CB82 TaxID=3039159 RepID=UPI0024B08770|nr:hypothetical protein [Bradyrhizobium sp. CB82]WFU37598.1 hypothetical protein QA640_24330 [Bradyrhizobium sp. CB82]